MNADRAGSLQMLIGEIDGLDRSGCLDRWREVFGRPSPKYLSPQFMKRVLIWETTKPASEWRLGEDHPPFAGDRFGQISPGKSEAGIPPDP